MAFGVGSASACGVDVFGEFERAADQVADCGKHGGCIAGSDLGIVESAQARWRAITGVHLVALTRAGAGIEKGVLDERQEQATWAKP